MPPPLGKFSENSSNLVHIVFPYDGEHCNGHLAILSETEGTGGVREVPDSVNLIYHMDQIDHHDFKYID